MSEGVYVDGIYCRTCDLGFCSAHLDEHPDYGRDLEEHDVEDRGTVPCSICSGILQPAP